MATITLPYTITNGQTTDATKLMADLNAIVTEVNGNLESVNIKDLAVITDKLAALAVTAAKLATDAVETLKIKDLNVTVAKLATDSVETLKIKDANVTAAKLATDAVETLKIKDANVTAAKIATDAVETSKIKDANVTAAKLDFTVSAFGKTIIDDADAAAVRTTFHGMDGVDFSGVTFAETARFHNPGETFLRRDLGA
jgi:hypothetical protein